MTDATTHNSSRSNSNHPTIDCTMDLQSSNKNDVFFKGLINTKPTLASPILEPKPYLALMAVRLHWTIGFLSPLYLRCNLMAVELIQRPDKWSFTLAIFNKTLFDNAQEAFLMNSLFRLPYGVSSTS
jgi:hypothetical protein